MLSGIDHLVILVPQLETAMADYERLGFTVLPGGVHPGGTHNALIAFADGAYLELIAFQNPAAPSNHRWHSFLASGGGLIDFALGTTDIAADIARVNPVQLPYPNATLHYEAQEGGRTRPDGVAVRWRNGITAPATTLPFIIEDVTPRSLRVASGDAVHHANGVVGVLSVTVAVRSLAVAKARFGTLLDTDPILERENPDLRAQAATYLVGQYSIELAQPLDASSPLEAHLAARGYPPLTDAQQAVTNGATAALHLGLGASPYSACLTVDRPDAATVSLDPAQAGGARFDLVPVKAAGA